MKKLLAAWLLMLLAISPAFAAGEAPATPIRFGTSATVYAIDAVYQVQTEQVESIDVTFSDVFSYAESNFVDGTLRLAIASAYPLDLSDVAAQAVATLTDGSQTAPVLELVSLRYNGVRATENYYPVSAEVSGTGSERTISVSAHSDFIGSSCRILVAAYEENGRFAAVNTCDLSFQKKDMRVDISLTGCANAKQVKVFFVTDDTAPTAKELIINLPQ